MQELKAQTGGIVLLTDEELAALQTEQRQVTEETATLRTQLKQEQDLRKWLTDEQKLAHDLEEIGKALQSLTERVESEDYKRNKSLLDDWDRTADVRFQWTEQVALQQRIRTSEEELEQLKEKYRSLSVGLGQLERMQVQCREQWAACETILPVCRKRCRCTNRCNRFWLCLTRFSARSSSRKIIGKKKRTRRQCIKKRWKSGRELRHRMNRPER